MKLRHCTVTLLAATVLAGASALAEELGDPAPPLDVAAWVKGGPVDLADGKGKNIYVIHFWFTASARGRATIPTVLEMYERYKYKDKGVVFIGISLEDLATVKAFVEGMGEKLTFPVALDNERATARAYLGGFQVKLVPHAFLIDKSGKIVWHGQSLRGLRNGIEAVLAGTYDMEEARRLEGADRLMDQYFQLVRSPGKAQQARAIGEQIIAKVQYDEVLMNTLAWKIVDEPGLITRDLDLALHAAQAAYDACGGKQAEIVDTYARVLFDRGRKKEAIQYQKKAVELATTKELRAYLTATLEKYEKAVSDE